MSHIKHFLQNSNTVNNLFRSVKSGLVAERNPAEPTWWQNVALMADPRQTVTRWRSYWAHLSDKISYLIFWNWLQEIHEAQVLQPEEIDRWSGQKYVYIFHEKLWAMCIPSRTANQGCILLEKTDIAIIFWPWSIYYNIKKHDDLNNLSSAAIFLKINLHWCLACVFCVLQKGLQRLVDIIENHRRRHGQIKKP